MMQTKPGGRRCGSVRDTGLGRGGRTLMAVALPVAACSPAATSVQSPPPASTAAPASASASYLGGAIARDDLAIVVGESAIWAAPLESRP